MYTTGDKLLNVMKERRNRDCGAFQNFRCAGENNP